MNIWFAAFIASARALNSTFFEAQTGGWFERMLTVAAGVNGDDHQRSMIWTGDLVPFLYCLTIAFQAGSKA
ncbi:MAG TPA: hypothetical protein VH107_00290 [Lacipirellulaceae bacterium]|nr:hypothetical protein [Lacipirellulaceae bacterium]